MKKYNESTPPELSDWKWKSGESSSYFEQEELDTKYFEATLGQVSRLLIDTTPLMGALYSFFDKKPPLGVRKMLSPYEDHILQFCLSDFMKEQEFELVDSFWFDGDFITDAQVKVVDYDKGKSFTTLDAGCNFYIHKHDNTHKLAIVIDDDRHNDGVEYRVHSNKDCSKFLGELLKFAKKRNFYRGKKIDAQCNFLDLNLSVDWDSIVLPLEVKRVIQKNVENSFKYCDDYKRNGISMKRGVILCGVPGVGKTHLCKIFARNTNATVLYVLPSHIENRRSVPMICDMARDLAPTLLILEDIDYIARDRGEQDVPIVIDLMNKLDGIEEFGSIVTLATTNHADRVEDAIKNRPGRFDRVITLPLPDKNCRLRMLEIFTEKYHLDEGFTFSMVVKDTDEMTGAHIKSLCETAAGNAIEAGDMDEAGIVVLTHRHMQDAIAEVKNKDFSTYNRAAKKARKAFSQTRIGFGGNNAFYDDDDIL